VVISILYLGTSAGAVYHFARDMLTQFLVVISSPLNNRFLDTERSRSVH